MKNLPSFALIGWVVMGFCYVTFTVSSTHAQQQTFQPRLSLMKDEEFHTWLVGTEWEYASGKTTYLYRFLTPRTVGWFKKEGDSSPAGYGYRIKTKGQVEWYRKPNGLKEHRIFEVAEDLKEAEMRFGKTSISLKLVSRIAQNAPAEMSPDQFNKWLQTQELIWKGNGRFIFEPGNKLVMKTNSNPNRTEDYIIPSAGTVEFAWGGNPLDTTLYIFSPDLRRYQMLVWWGDVRGPVNSRLPEEKGKLTVKKNAVSIQGAPAITLKGRQAATHSLTVVDLEHSRMVGKASKLSVSALKLVTAAPASLAFNQDVGEQMAAALREVAKFLALRHGGWPTGAQIKLAFADKHSPKDGPSAALASAVVLESLITGELLDPSVAITGDLNADGSVQPVGGVTAKLRGASREKMNLVLIPEKNRKNALDLIKSEGLTPFLGPQILSAGSFDEAWALAKVEKDIVIQQNLALFTSLTQELKASPGKLASVGTIQSLETICQTVPNHVSARLLLAMAQGRLPDKLSPAGSLEAIDIAVADVLNAAGTDLSATIQLDAGQLSAAKAKLTLLRTLVDLRVQPYADAWLAWAGLADQIIVRRSTPPHVITQFKQAALHIRAEGERLSKDVEFNEELMQ